MACYYCEKIDCQENCINFNFRAPHKDKAKCKCIFCARCKKPTLNDKNYFDDDKNIYCDDCIEWIEAMLESNHCIDCGNCLCCACEYEGYITDNIHNHYVDCANCKTWMVGGDDYL